MHVGVGRRVPHDHLRVDLEGGDDRHQRRVGPRQDLAVGGAERQRDVVVAVDHGLEVGADRPGRPRGPRRSPRWAGRASRAGRTRSCSRRRPCSRARSGCRWRRTPTRGTSRSGSRSGRAHVRQVDAAPRPGCSPPARSTVGCSTEWSPGSSPAQRRPCWPRGGRVQIVCGSSDAPSSKTLLRKVVMAQRPPPDVAPPAQGIRP